MVLSSEFLSPNRDYAPILLALLAAALAHVLVLYFLKFGVPGLPAERVISVRLERQPVAAPVVAPRPQPVPKLQEKERRQTVPVVPMPAEVTPLVQSPIVDPVEEPTPAVRGAQLYLEALDAVRKLPAPEGQGYRTFSVEDFPSKQEERDSWAPPTYIRQFARQPETVEYTNSQGMGVKRHVDEFGNVTCSQEIDYVGDGFPPMWYRSLTGC